MATVFEHPDLFTGSAEPIVSGLSYAAAILSMREEADLIANIDAAPLQPFRFQRWLGKRLTASFGWSYDFETGTFAPTEPIPAWLDAIKARVAAFAGLDPDDLVQALLIRYDPGAGIGWHRDRPVFEDVVGVSLGAPATLRLRKRVDGRFARAAVPLEPRSVYHLSGAVRHAWEHSIAPMDVARWSITFRSLASGAPRR